MTNIPRTIDANIDFAVNHAGYWKNSFASIGIPLADATELETLAGTAVDLRQESLQAQDDARVAVASQNAAIDAMNAKLGALLTMIEGYAKNSADPDAVYAAAKIPAPKTPSPRPAPEVPTALTGQVTNEGGVELTWKGSRAYGVTFLIERAFPVPAGVAAEWTVLNTVQQNSFTDTNVPVGQSALLYRVKAMRGGQSSSFTDPTQVLFGAVNGQQNESGDGSMPMAA